MTEEFRIKIQGNKVIEYEYSNSATGAKSNWYKTNVEHELVASCLDIRENLGREDLEIQ